MAGTHERFINYLTAASLVVAFGCLFVGRVLMYPLSRLSGTFLDRVAVESAVWDSAHRWLLVGIVALIPAVLGVRRVLWHRAPWLADLGSTLTILGAVLTVGQFAIDFVMSVAAPIEPRAATEELVRRLRDQPFVRFTFYTLPNLAGVGNVLLGLAFLKQGAGWRVPAIFVNLGIWSFLFASFVGLVPIYWALGLLLLGNSMVARKIAVNPPV